MTKTEIHTKPTDERTTFLKSELEQTRSEYLRERELLISGEHSAADGFSKAVITLSAAALGFSISLVQFIETPISAMNLLYATWISFSVTVLATVSAYYASQIAYRTSHENLKAEHETDVEEIVAELESRLSTSEEAIVPISSSPNRVPAESIVDWLNRIALAALLIGFVSLVIFSICNV